MNSAAPTPNPLETDLDDDRDDEHNSENEARVREVDENMEAPEEFEVDDEGRPGHPEDDDTESDAEADETAPDA